MHSPAGFYLAYVSCISVFNPAMELEILFSTVATERDFFLLQIISRSSREPGK